MASPIYTRESISPWRIGWLAAKANFVPGLILQVVAVSLVIAYYTVPAVESWLGSLAELKRQGGYFYSACSGMFFCGFLPWCFRMGLKALRPKNPWSDLTFSLGWWAWMGMQTDAFYRFQGVIWGDGTSPWIVVAKVATDMLVYTPLIASPMNAIAHLWKAGGFDFTVVRSTIKRGWYRRIVMPNLVPNWMLWTPGTGIVYSLPSLLQLPMANLIGCFWSLLCITIAAGDEKKNASSENGQNSPAAG
ncbi:MAG: hypothetical protein LBV12_08715 [Puniceicoccales bacterium]|jgi:hypothetical protein|nr:hypothetical protein [Puniceicoccales bacterium]